MAKIMPQQTNKSTEYANKAIAAGFSAGYWIRVLQRKQVRYSPDTMDLPNGMRMADLARSTRAW